MVESCVDGISVLIVDDDKALRDLLERYLAENGYLTRAVNDGVEMKRRLQESQPDIIVLDLMLPGEDGLVLAKHIRSNSNVPVIILSARGDEVDRIVGLEIGADDYIAKPFNPRELLARIRSVLRRSRDGKENLQTDEQIKMFGPYRLMSHTRQLFNERDEVPLTCGDFSLLEVFVNNPGRVLNRDSLLQLLKGYGHHPFDRSIDVRITRLRRKIEPDPSRPVYIKTIWGQGYLFSPESSES